MTAAPYQRRGIGRALLNALIPILQLRQVNSVFAWHNHETHTTLVAGVTLYANPLTHLVTFHVSRCHAKGVDLRTALCSAK